MVLAYCLMTAGGLLSFTSLIAIALKRNALHCQAHIWSACGPPTPGSLNFADGRAAERAAEHLAVQTTYPKGDKCSAVWSLIETET
jgi:hypothetical protein